nr:WD repeat-containing protein [Aspergillus niger CBS 513.88]|eukprot:XP_001390970.2 WD repeat-containing protein [Aspergillus niger CBS 513.88]
MGNDEISDFEKQRLANIAERDALLKKLTMEAQSSGLFPPKMPKPAAKDQSRTKKKTPVKKVKEETPQPRRMSSRLRGIAAESEVAKRKAEEEYEARQEAERAKRVRKSDNFSFSDIMVNGQKLPADGLIGVDVVTKGVAIPYQRTFGDDEIQKTTDKDLKALRKEMNGLTLWEAWEPNRIKLTPERVYTMTFHPTESKPLIFAGDKMGHLGILDASQEKPTSIKPEDDEESDDEDPDPVLTTVKPHTRTISSMHIHPSTPTTLYTASYDSSIRAMDLEKSTSVEKYAPESTSSDEPISGIDMALDDPNVLYWTTLDGAFGRHDIRTDPTAETVNTWQLSDLDRSMRLWDLRMLQKPKRGKKDEGPTPVGEHYSRLSVSHAAFNSAGQIATSSYDDTLKIYDLKKKGISNWDVGHAVSEDELGPDTVR